MRILITAGPTREYFDSVRFISNPSSGKMGYALAESAVADGHEVILVSGPVELTRAAVAKIEREKFAIVPVGTKRVLVLEDSDGAVHALNARCTHEGCTVRYVPGEALISCACHNARFDLDGRVLSGPPPRPLPKYLARREDDGGIVVSIAAT